MLTYLYTSDYYDGGPKNSDESEDDDVDASIVSGLMANVLVYALAEKYNIEELKLLAFDKFWRLSNAFAGFPAVVDAVYTTTPDSDKGMRRVIIESVPKRSAQLQKMRVCFVCFSKMESWDVRCCG